MSTESNARAIEGTPVVFPAAVRQVTCHVCKAVRGVNDHVRWGLLKLDRSGLRQPDGRTFTKDEAIYAACPSCLEAIGAHCEAAAKSEDFAVPVPKAEDPCTCSNADKADVAAVAARGSFHLDTCPSSPKNRDVTSTASNR